MDRTVRITEDPGNRDDVPADGRLIVPGGRSSDPLFALAAERVKDAGKHVAGSVAMWQARVKAAERVDATRHNPSAWAQASAEAVDALLRGGVTTADLPTGVSRRVMTAAALAEQTTAELAGSNLLPRAAVMHTATTLGGPPGDTWHLRGYVDLTPETARFVARHALPGSSVHLQRPSDACLSAFTAEGWTVHDERREPSAPPAPHAAATAHAYSFGSQDEEVRWVLADIARRIDAGTDPSSLLMVDAQAAARRGVYRQIASEFAVPVRLAAAPALGDTPEGQLVLRLLEVVDRPFGYEPILRILQHQHLPKMDAEAYDQARLNRPQTLAAWKRFDARAEALHWPERDTPNGFTERLAITLEHLGLAGATDALGAASIEAGDGQPTVLQEVLAAAGAGTEPQTRRSYVQTARIALQLQRTETQQTFGPDAASHAVVATWDDTAHRHGAAVTYVLGANEGRLPPRLKDDATLDFHDRALLQAAGLPMETAQQRAERQQVHLQEVLSTTQHTLILGVPAQDDREALLPSPILDTLGLTLQPAPARAARSLQEVRQGFLDQPGKLQGTDPLAQALTARLATERRRESEQPHDHHDGVGLDPRDPAQAKFSATSLSDFGGCPFKFFARYLLKVRDYEEETGLLPPRVRGRLWHHTLELAGRAATKHLIAEGWTDEDGTVLADEVTPGDRAHAYRQAVLDHLDEAFTEAERDEYLPESELWSRMREVELTSLRRLVVSDAFLEPTAIPYRYEAKLNVVLEGLPFVGYVDRIDRKGDGLDLIDYKLGASKPPGVPDATRRATFDVQLPLYRALLQESEGVQVRKVRYLSMRTGENLDSDEQREGEPPQVDVDLLDLIDRIKEQFANGRFPVQPDEKRHACERCDLHAVCRVGPRLDRKPDALGFEVQP